MISGKLKVNLNWLDFFGSLLALLDYLGLKYSFVVSGFARHSMFGGLY